MFIHLCNNSINKNTKKNEEIEGNMWFIDQLEKYLKESYGLDYQDILKQMEQIV